MFSTSQVRQLYVVTGLTDSTPSTEGNIQVKATAGNKEVYFLHKGKGGLVHSDLIPVKLIRSLTQTARRTRSAVIRIQNVARDYRRETKAKSPGRARVFAFFS